MPLIAGTRLGSYEIVGLLGRGGMGQVFRARDARLNRDVAIKVIPDAFAHDQDRVARFAREAQVLAALNHPGIAQIYGFEELPDASGPQTQTSVLVMELVEGDDLSEVISRSGRGGPMAGLPLPEVLAIARQVADALEAAHERGIIHRDLKPANIKIRADGTAKVLDFGLAKAAATEGMVATADAANSPTLTGLGTQMGVILGTAAYMAPEQAKGRTVDKRADIWAFGVVVYEMLTGRQLFEGESVAETLGLIFAREPDLAALPAETPAALRTLVARCLVKDPRQRLRDIGDGRQLIDDAIAGRGEAAVSAAAPVAAGPARPQRVLLGIAAIALTAIAAAAGWFAHPSLPQAPYRLSIALPPGEEAMTVPAISADGQRIAYASGRRTGSSQLYLRGVNDFTSHPVANSVGAQYPFFSADGQTIAFFAGGKLRRASVAGGTASDLASAAGPWGGTFDADGRIVYTTALGSGLWRILAEGGTPEQLTKPDGAASGYAHVFPQRLPGTRDLLFTFWGQTFNGAVLSAADNTWRPATPPLSSSAGVHVYLHSGHLMGNDLVGTVLVGPWTPSVTTPVSVSTPLLSNVQSGASTDQTWISVSETGTAVYVPGNPQGRRAVWVDRQGRESAIPGATELVYQATVSRHGRRVAYGSMRSQWIQDLATGARTRLATDIRAWHGMFIDNDRRVVISSNRDGDWDLYTVSVDGGDLAPLLKRPFAQHPQDVAPDGSIIFLERHAATGNDLWTLSPGGQATPLVVTRFNENAPSVSADGRYVAYASDESGRSEVYAVAASGKGDRVRVSIDGGSGPVWSRTGRELFYRAGETIMSVGVHTSGALVLGQRQAILDYSPYDPGYFRDFDVSPDGQRFLVIRPDPAARPTRIDVITNWFDDVRKATGR